jgi:hypothetical protein
MMSPSAKAIGPAYSADTSPPSNLERGIEVSCSAFLKTQQVVYDTHHRTKRPMLGAEW